jgi:hypothetical protein
MPPPPRLKYNPFSRRFYHSVYGYGLHKTLGFIQRLSPAAFHPARLAAEFLDNRLDDCVRYGIFAGMNLKPTRGKANQYYSKLLGIYEKELLPVWHQVIGRSYDLILNVGAAEGYYAVGLALAHRNVKVVAFEASDASRTVLANLAAANDARVDIYGFCDVPSLVRVLEGVHRALIILDIEGFEYELLAACAIDQLRACDVLLETHEVFGVPVAQEIISRFSPTHDVQVISARRRRLADLPFEPPNSFALRVGLFELLQEHRSYPQEWLWMEAKNE